MHEDISKLCLDDQFMILLHKKIMDKAGSAKRRAKKYYIDQYKKTGISPNHCGWQLTASWRGASAVVDHAH